MKRSEVREHIFRILFCVEFCEKEEFEDQVELYFHGHESINEKTQKEITAKTENLIEHLDEIDEEISAHTNAWNLERLGKAELSILRLATPVTSVAAIPAITAITSSAIFTSPSTPCSFIW